MVILSIWLLVILITNGGESYEGFDPTGGVSEEKKLKIDNTYKIDDCDLRAQEDDIIEWHYKGMLLNGKVFDEGKYKAQLGHRTIIEGVDQGMRGLCVGEKRRMAMHPDWAYGSRGTDGIPPNSVLIFDVELLVLERPGVGKRTLEERFKDDGGVSKENKLKIVELLKVDPEQCKMQSAQDDRIHWHYKGKLLDGHVFDEGKFNARLGHNDVITGVDKAMRGLCVGEKRRMVIHPDWAYGERGVPGTIPSGAVLVFDVQLLSIEKPDGTKDAFYPDSKKSKTKTETESGSPENDKLKIEITHTIPDTECKQRSQEDDTINWWYKGTFLDGTEFHTGTFEATLGHGHVITGVDKGMRNMCVGEKRRLTIHPDWAYGDEGRPGSIPPKATLVFDVELHAIHRPEKKEEL